MYTIKGKSISLIHMHCCNSIIFLICAEYHITILSHHLGLYSHESGDVRIIPPKWLQKFWYRRIKARWHIYLLFHFFITVSGNKPLSKTKWIYFWVLGSNFIWIWIKLAKCSLNQLHLNICCLQNVDHFVQASMGYTTSLYLTLDWPCWNMQGAIGVIKTCCWLFQCAIRCPIA